MLSFARTVALATLALPLSDAGAANRWSLLAWCESHSAADSGRCEGVIEAALDLTTHADFDPPPLCFASGTQLPQVRAAVVRWLKENRVREEESALALVAQALRETYACPPRS